MFDYKEKIIHSLNAFYNKELLNKNHFKARAYKTVLDQIKKLDNVKNFEDLKNIKGIGIGIKNKLCEIFKSNKLHSVDNDLKIYGELLKIYGIGSEKAKNLINKYNIRSINDLHGKKYLLNKAQKVGLKYYKDLSLKIPREEMTKHFLFVKSLLPGIKIKLLGSYRRNSAYSKDLDFIILTNDHSNHSKIVEKLKEIGYLLDDFFSGDKKYMGVCSLNGGIARHIDILFTTLKEYPFATLYFTGDYSLNIQMRKKAKKMGYSLNEHGLEPKVDLKTEKAIFNFLGFKYLQPKDRTARNLKEL